MGAAGAGRRRVVGWPWRGGTETWGPVDHGLGSCPLDPQSGVQTPRSCCVMSVIESL